MHIKKRTISVLVGATLVTSVAIGVSISAADEETNGPGAPAGEPYTGDDMAQLSESRGQTEAITVGGTNYDPTVVTKFIAGTEFDPLQGDSPDFDTVNGTVNHSCISPAAGSTGSLATFQAGLELPDGALVKRLVMYGSDTDASNMTLRLSETVITVPIVVGPVPTRSDNIVTSFTTTGASGVFAIASAANLDEVVGSEGSIATGIRHHFHVVHVTVTNAAGVGHTLCGVEVQYQVPASTAAAGTVFHVIDPVRAFDSRKAAYPASGLLAPNASKVISVKDGHNDAGAVTAADALPANATAVAYNITITGATGPNFVSVTAGDAAGFTTSAINFNGTADVANAGTVQIDGARQIKVWGGDQTGSMHVIIDITGYYAPPPPFPNMAN